MPHFRYLLCVSLYMRKKRLKHADKNIQVCVFSSTKMCDSGHQLFELHSTAASIGESKCHRIHSNCSHDTAWMGWAASADTLHAHDSMHDRTNARKAHRRQRMSTAWMGWGASADVRDYTLSMYDRTSARTHARPHERICMNTAWMGWGASAAIRHASTRGHVRFGRWRGRS